MIKKKIKLTILAYPDAGFLQRVLLILSRRKISLSKFRFEALDLTQELYCQLELEINEDLLQNIIKQIENLVAVKNVIFDVKEMDFSITN